MGETDYLTSFLTYLRKDGVIFSCFNIYFATTGRVPNLTFKIRLFLVVSVNTGTRGERAVIFTIFFLSDSSVYW